MKLKQKALEWLSPLRTRNFLDENCNKHLPGTGDWLLQSMKYTSWRDDNGSNILWINGKPGCGKSVLAARVWQDLVLERKLDTTIAYAFCRRADQSSQNTETILGSLGRQIDEKQQGVDSVLLQEFSASDRPEKPSKRAVRDILHSVISAHGTCFLLINALDELASRSSEAIAEELIILVEDQSNLLSRSSFLAGKIS